MKQITYQGKTCRYNYRHKLYVSRDGLVVLLAGGQHELPIQTEPVTGKPYVINVWLGCKSYVDELVVECFCPPMPRDGRKYRVFHRDYNPKNCDARNLTWRLEPYVHTTTPTTTFTVEGKLYTLREDGTVDGLQVHDYFVDQSTGRKVVISPYIKIAKVNDPNDYWAISIEKLMEEGGYIQGDNSILRNPVIIHKNGDYLDCSSQNLEFVEENEHFHFAYLHKKRKAMAKREKELNQ